ncbi:hypothetical protein NL676_004538 [Syzygium grande]|nr:hypothetical protein NL676_004538 [Syzygium grande]
MAKLKPSSASMAEWKRRAVLRWLVRGGDHVTLASLSREWSRTSPCSSIGNRGWDFSSARQGSKSFVSFSLVLGPDGLLSSGNQNHPDRS